MDNVQALFDVQSAHRWTMAQSTTSERKAMLLALKKEIISRREEIKAAMYADFKKPYAESELTEIHTSIDEINFAVKKLSKWMKPKKVKTPIALFGSKSFIQYEAKGVVLILAPWNYPFSLLINPLVAAIAAGNCVIARPSEKTPHTAKILESVIGNVFSDKIAKVVIGEIDLAEKLLELPFDHIFFTGSTQVGKVVMAAAAKHLTPVTLELGGKSPVIIDRDVNLEDCAEKLFWGKFMNGGQTCVAPDYLFIPEELKADFIELFKKQIEKRFGETSSERLKTEDFARMVDVKAYDRLANKIKDEKKLLEDGPQSDERFIPPTLLTDVTLNSPVMEDEIFGPILPLLTYKKLETVIDYIRAHPKPLALYVFSKNKKMIKNVLKSTTSGGAAINHVVLHLANPNLPFGGVGHSGMGSYHGEFGFKTFSHERAVLNQGRFTLTSLYFPPYTTALSKFAFRVLRWLE
ncbi:aldehyde dehydrogenase family protein [Bacteriovorax sp. PP10]|uniref:Aldehyde dehydrogenase n=1 Tax=Bacteriovorax antarcticus TaxID=3088717 RepID=A0ABU5VWU2_9BACT|nr:aldehyde dehydrogenase family protein [Bacteriovorax sp. PP10]MEA9357528.1 aldehyde dehydrogenase family protein [Bacteriovorax sp. PP10]